VEKVHVIVGISQCKTNHTSHAQLNGQVLPFALLSTDGSDFFYPPRQKKKAPVHSDCWDVLAGPTCQAVEHVAAVWYAMWGLDMVAGRPRPEEHWIQFQPLGCCKKGFGPALLD
jgi:hypothetical protein